MDDKAKISVGEPGTPEAATSHSRRALTTKGVTLTASDHDYHIANITPSVSLLCDIPEAANESFYSGQIYVGLKDSVFEASSPMRHVVELTNLLYKHYDELPPYLCLFTDGGPDHCIKFLYVQCTLLALFRCGDFDILNVGRCAPCQSYMNPAERCMSLLNIGLQGLALERDHAGGFEPMIKNCSTMKSLRTKAIEQQGLEDAFRESLLAPIKTLESSFGMLELKRKSVKIFQPDDNADEFIWILREIDLLITSSEEIPHSMAKLKDYPQLKQYFETHLTDGLYMLQFRKCTDRTCCILRNDILPPPIPAPVLSEDKQHYMKFEETYGKGKTTEKDCPLQSKEGNKKSSANKNT